MIGEGRRDRADQLAYEAPIKVNTFTSHICAHLFPISQRDIIAKNHAHVFKNIHRGVVDPLDLLGRHWFC